MRHLASSAASHASLHGASYFSDYVQAHIDLGLAVSVGKATVILSPLDAHKVRLYRSELNYPGYLNIYL